MRTGSAVGRAGLRGLLFFLPREPVTCAGPCIPAAYFLTRVGVCAGFVEDDARRPRSTLPIGPTAGLMPTVPTRSGRATRRLPMRTAIVIPARYASKRLPGKPLLRSTGKYL